MVDVVDDYQFGLEDPDELLDVAVEGVEVLALGAEDVKADEVDVFLGGGVGSELAVDLGADVGAVEGVDPEEFTLAGWAGLTGRTG